MANEKTQNSNSTGMRIALEATPGVLPVTPIWHSMEPNDYGDFGGELTTKARAPISRTRQRKKGSPIDLDANGGFSQDFTETGLLGLMQGFLFADATAGFDTVSIVDEAAVILLTSLEAADSSMNAAAGLDGFTADDIVLVSGCAIASNNGIKTVASALAGKITLDEAVIDELTPPSSVRVQKVGTAASDLSVVVSGAQIVLTSAGAEDFTTWPIHVGSWLFIGSDAKAFTASANQCFARVDVITATTLTLGKTQKQMVADAGPTAVDVFIPISIRNEPDPDDIICRTYQLERTLGRDANGVMSEYLVESYANEFTLNMPTADYLGAELAFVSTDNEQRTGAVGLKTGTRPVLPTEDAYNTSTDVSRFRLSPVIVDDPFPSALFGYASEATIKINNNVTPNKGIGVLGAFSMNVGNFDVGGELTVYFATLDAVKAVRDNVDTTMDLVVAKNNAGWVFDVPLIGLGDGKLNIEANSPITLPLEATAAESHLGHTLYLARFAYLPDAAED